MVEIPLLSNIHGQYTVQLLNASGTEIVYSSTFDNIITDGGMDALGELLSGEVYAFDYCQVGEGSATPTSIDTGLVAPVAGRVNTDAGATTTVSGSNVSGAFWDITISRLFTDSQGNGNLTEIGMFTKSTGGRMTSRALIRDESGTPITLTKTSANQLRVLYKLRTYVPSGDVTGSFSMGGTSHAYTIRPQLILTSMAWGNGASNGTFFTTGGYLFHLLRSQWTTFGNGFLISPSGSLVNPTGSISNTSAVAATTVTPSAYVAGTFYRDVTAVFDPTIGNFGTTGIRSLTMQPCMIYNGLTITPQANYQMVISPNILKVSTQRLTFVFRFGWNRSATSE